MSGNEDSSSLDNTIINARSYQIEIMEQAKSENLIVCLPTGSGKTFIAIMLIKELLPITQQSLTDGGKRTILLTKTVELARQHQTTMAVHIKNSKIATHTGSSTIPLEQTQRWKDEFEKHSVLIFTVQIFLNLLTHSLFSLDQVNLLIFDECHHATGSDPYARIMRDYYPSCRKPPRILGLTASISAQKIELDKLPRAARDLEAIFQARIETGSDQSEIALNSTLVKPVHQRCSTYKEKICSKDKKVMNIFKELETLMNEIKTKKTNKNDSTNNVSLQSQNRMFDQLKSHLDNVLSVGYDLGLYGLSLAVKALRNHLTSPNFSMMSINLTEKDFHDKIKNKLDDLFENYLKELHDSHPVRYSDKVIQTEKRIRENQSGQTIVFVERIYTAKFLCHVLREIIGKRMKIEYLTGSKTGLNDENFSSREQRKIAESFRKNEIQVLVSTAVIEEGLDVAACSLVIRFNKPQNFSSYMQSKGRARAKDGKALFVLLRDENDIESWTKSKEEYENYEYMEKMLKRNFKADMYDDTSADDDVQPLKPYRTKAGARIGGIHAIEIVYRYCASLPGTETSLPQFCFHVNESGKFVCTLSMPGPCPIKDYIVCENKNKRFAKQECCLQMVKKLHEIDKLDDRCLPIRISSSFKPNQNSDDVDVKEEISVQTIDKQIAHFPARFGHSSTQWYLYRINLTDNNDLGFVVPCQLSRLPKFQLYGTDREFTVEIIFLKTIALQQYIDELKAFCRHIFDDVFDHFNAKSDANLQFDLENSPFQLLPCLLTQSDDLDQHRMASICNRKSGLIQNPNEIDDQEVYIRLDTPDKQFLRTIFDPSPPKYTSDLWDHKRKLSETIATYADHFEYKVQGLHINRDFEMVTMQPFRKPRINYLKNSSSETDSEKRLISIVARADYFPIEVLRYAPLNQRDFELIYKLPCILVRMGQLTFIEQFRKLLAQQISLTLVNSQQMSSVTFQDCLPNIFASNQSTVLPLISFDYKHLLNSNRQFELPVDLIFQAINRRSAAEQTDMENLEILGDCFLKLAMSISLYHQYPLEHSGELTPRKDYQVSNRNLYRLATEKNLKDYISAQEVRYAGKDRNWLPPGYTITGEHSDRFLKQRSKQKAFADMIEALFGAFLISTDYYTTIRFMDWLGLKTIPKDEQKLITTTPSVLYSDHYEMNEEIKKEIQKYFIEREFTEVERRIGYTFQNKAYVIAAFTHPSYSNGNRLTQCYDRLEYLGDAVLDFLLIRCIFVEYYECVTPSHVTSIRHDLSNNGRLAYFLVSRGLHTYILHYSSELFLRLNNYVKDEDIFSNKNPSGVPNNITQWADTTAPKALADVFEALVGAIFLDSGYSFSTVWMILEPILRDYIKQSVHNPNINPIRSFYEQKGEIFYDEKDSAGYSICRAKLPTGEEFIGRGKNRKSAKYDACQRAVNSQKR